jgi:hypothetical protein
LPFRVIPPRFVSTMESYMEYSKFDGDTGADDCGGLS